MKQLSNEATFDVGEVTHFPCDAWYSQSYHSDFLRSPTKRRFSTKIIVENER